MRSPVLWTSSQDRRLCFNTRQNTEVVCERTPFWDQDGVNTVQLIMTSMMLVGAALLFSKVSAFLPNTLPSIKVRAATTSPSPLLPPVPRGLPVLQRISGALHTSAPKSSPDNTVLTKDVILAMATFLVERSLLESTRLCGDVKRTPNSITFKATSNDVSPTESARSGVSLRYLIRDNTIFRDAFRPKEHPTNTIPSPGFQRIPFRPSADSKSIIIQSSVSKEPVHMARFGLVSAVMEAYNKHHNLCLRPDDIWQAILTQFSFYVNANAEELRDCFVDFEGKKTLVITMGGSLFSANFGSFAKRMVDEKIAINLKDEEVAQWLLPSFSTTTNDDRIAASVSIMSTLQSYFEYACGLLCGIPQVTLEGKPDDWRILRQKIDRLPTYDLNGATPGCMAKWHTLLAPVLDEFVASSEGHPRLEFWDKVCSRVGGGSGPSYLSGWITVFACFTAKGEWQGEIRGDPPTSSYARNERGLTVPWERMAFPENFQTTCGWRFGSGVGG